MLETVRLTAADANEGTLRRSTALERLRGESAFASETASVESALLRRYPWAIRTRKQCCEQH